MTAALNSQKQDYLDVNFSDFNQTNIHLSLDGTGTPLRISLVSPSIKAIQSNYDVQDCLKEYLGKSKLQLLKTAESGFDISFELDPNTLTGIFLRAVDFIVL